MWFPISTSIIYSSPHVSTIFYFECLIHVPLTTPPWIQVAVARKLRQPASTRPRWKWNPNDPCFDWKLGLVFGGWPSKIEVIWVPSNVYLRNSKGRRRIKCEKCYEIKISMLNLDTSYKYIPCHVSHEFLSYFTFVSRLESPRTDFTYSNHHLVSNNDDLIPIPPFPCHSQSCFLFQWRQCSAIRAPFWSKLLLQQKWCNINHWKSYMLQ